MTPPGLVQFAGAELKAEEAIVELSNNLAEFALLSGLNTKAIDWCNFALQIDTTSIRSREIRATAKGVLKRKMELS